MKPDYQFDDDDQTLPVWIVKHQDREARETRRPFFKQDARVRAASRRAAIEKVQNYFPHHDRFTASPSKL